MATKISENYKETAVQAMSLNITEDEMFILIPSETDASKLYRVEMIEETMQPKSCNCLGFCRWHHCKHCTIIAECFASYKPIVTTPATPVETRITEIEPNNWYIINRNTQVWRTEDGRWLAAGPTANAIQIVEAHLAVKAAEQIVASPKVVEVTEQAIEVPVVYAKLACLHNPPCKGKDLGKVGNLNTSRAFTLMR